MLRMNNSLNLAISGTAGFTPRLRASIRNELHATHDLVGGEIELIGQGTAACALDALVALENIIPGRFTDHLDQW
jgi:hypothetical protein